jgi:two-component system, cell cycle response regulator
VHVSPAGPPAAGSLLPVSAPEVAPPRLRTLLAEDNPIFQTMLRSLLARWGYEAVLARDGDEAWQALSSSEPPRLAILDWMMPGVDGVELCRRIRAAGQEPYIYILLLTARTEAGDLVEGMDAGADDYLTKPFKAHELRVRLRAGRRILELQEQLLLAREALRDQATHDGLTGMLNRAAIFEALEHEIDRAQRERGPLAVLMTDIDLFKKINDTWGHGAGDFVLKETAARMQHAVRAYDSLGRYGGEEFLLVLPGCTAEAAAERAERLRQAIALAPFETGRESIRVTCSVGVSARAHALRTDLEAMVREADVALYAAKQAGRNRVATHHPV